MSKILTAIALLITLAAPAIAANVGEQIPTQLELQDQNATQQSFDSIKGENGTVLVFVRSVDWCPYCQAQLIDLGQNASQIEELGYSVVAISYDETQSQKKFSDKYDFKHTLLSDTGSETIKAFGILNEDMDPSSDYYGVPHPTIYVVDRDGIITDKIAEEGYKKRPPVEAIVEAIKN